MRPMKGPKMFENNIEETHEQQSFTTTLVQETVKAAVIGAATVAGMYGGMVIVGWISKKMNNQNNSE